MKLESFSYQNGKGWSLSEFPKLDSSNTVIFVFADPEFFSQHQAIDELRKKYPASKLIGCSTSGEILGDRVFDHGLSVCVAQFEKTTLEVSAVPIKGGNDSRVAGRELANSLNKPGLKGLLTLSDGLHVNGSELVSGMNSILGKQVVATGGLAGDGSNFKRTWVIGPDGSPQTDMVTAIGLYGDSVRISHGSKGGWDKFGPERMVTRSEGNVLYELDDQPALKLYKEYLGEKAKDLPASGLLFPLSLKSRTQHNKSLVRTVLSVNEENQSMTFAGDLPEGHVVQLMQANFDRLIDGACGAATNIGALDANKPTLAVAISCVGRRLVLGERIEEELEATLEVLPKGTKQVGFYSYGEMSPYIKGEACDLHNQTMTLTAFQED